MQELILQHRGVFQNSIFMMARGEQRRGGYCVDIVGDDMERVIDGIFFCT
jgi:hypothetical protein